MRHWWMDTVTVQVDTDDIIEHIPFEKLEEEYKKRVELKANDPEQFAKEERCNTDDIDVDICPDDYDLVYKEDVTLDEFGESEIICHLEQHGYNVFEKGYTSDSDADCVARYMDELSPYAKREFICDIFGVQHCVSREAILETIKEMI